MGPSNIQPNYAATLSKNNQQPHSPGTLLRKKKIDLRKRKKVKWMAGGRQKIEEND